MNNYYEKEKKNEIYFGSTWIYFLLYYEPWICKKKKIHEKWYFQIDYFQKQVPNNIKDLELVVLQFRAEIGKEIKSEDMKIYERSIVKHFHE